MKRFIRYLYEYEHGKRIRNVGFVKVEAGDEETIVHMQGKGFHKSGDRKLVLYLFYEENGKVIGIRQAEATLNSPMMSFQLRYTPKDTGEVENYPKIQGILFETESGRRLAATWDDRAMDVDEFVMWSPRPVACAAGQEEAKAGCDAPENEELSPSTSEAGQEEAKAGRDAPENEELSPSTSEAGREEAKAGHDVPEMLGCVQGAEGVGQNQEECGSEAQEVTDYAQSEVQNTQSESQIAQPEPGKIIKIQRQDIARLPRCEWKLANNRFLMHGYQNYRHLVLIRNRNCWKLGVPGIYHINEARLAENFGFGEFLPIEEVEILLNKEECHQDEPFGYWCRRVRMGTRQS